MRFIVNDEKLIATYCLGEGLKLSSIRNLPKIQINKDYPYSFRLQQFLEGKELLYDEIPFPFDIIEKHYESGYVKFDYGVVVHGAHFICNRCSNDHSSMFSPFQCARCGEICHYCRQCIMMGRVSECTPLISWVGPPTKCNSNPSHHLAWEGSLSKGQANASIEIVNTIENSKEVLIWAVCGAGKTEILFEGLRLALNKGKKVCITTPRTDVVLELAPRLKKAFPLTKVIALYGGSEERFDFGELYIATTHQLLRFKEVFDVVIIDEVDAFPFSMDKSLQLAVEKSRKPTSALIYLTATPSEQWKKDNPQNKRRIIKIPARYHGHPLPVPTYQWCGNWQKEIEKGRLPKSIHVWLQNQLCVGRQAFLFVPNVSILKSIEKICEFYHDKIESVHAEDDRRKEKVLKFRHGEIPIIITTTILERGVTIANSDVAVLGAEDDIFTESALVQIAGRVGRHADYPDGNITFFHYGKTDAMIRAKRHIEQMNEEAVMGSYLSKSR